MRANIPLCLERNGLMQAFSLVDGPNMGIAIFLFIILYWQCEFSRSSLYTENSGIMFEFCFHIWYIWRLALEYSRRTKMNKIFTTDIFTRWCNFLEILTQHRLDDAKNFLYRKVTGFLNSPHPERKLCSRKHEDDAMTLKWR